MSKNREKKDPVILLLDLVIVALLFVMIYNGATALFYKDIADKRSFTQDAGMLSFDLERGDYAGFIQGKYINQINGDTEAVSYYALADYIEAAFMYKVCAAKGYTDRAAGQKTIMDESRAAMGELTVFADKVDEMLGR